MGRSFSLARSLAIAAAAFLAFAPTAQAQQKINIFSGVSPVFAPAFIADTKGYFKEEKLDVNLRLFTSGGEATEGFRSGGAQFLIAGDVPLLYQLVGGDAVLLTQFSANPGMMIVVGNNKVASAADLKGKKIGLVRKSAAEYLLNNYLQTAGLKLTDVQLVALAPFDQIPAVVRGDIDAMSTWKPFQLKVFGLSKDHKILTESGQVGYTLYSGILTKRNLLTPENKPMMMAVMRAIKKGSDWLAANNIDVTSKAIADYVKSTPEDVKDVIKDNRWDLTSDAPFRKAMKDIGDFLHAQGFFDKNIDWDKAVDWTYLRELDPKLLQN